MPILPILLTTTAVFVWAHAAATAYVCISHPTPICDNPQTPPPDFAHENPEPPSTPGNVPASIVTANSSGGNVHLRAANLTVGSPELGSPMLRIL